MAFCRKCGTQLADDQKFCPSCGTPVAPAAVNFANDFNNTADTTAEFDPADIQQNKIMAIFAYIGILVLIPILAAPNSKFARFHANQGLVLLIVDVAVGVVTSVLGVILGFIPVVGALIVALISAALGILLLVLMILGIVNAANGQAKELPLIGSFRLLK
jgi:uncharacterized membrane protein